MGRRQIVKAAAGLIALGYCSLLVYQNGVTFNFQENRLGLVQVSDGSIEPVTKTSINKSGQHKNITLNDVFISVKTTKHYEHSRLPIILKTWFQLAKNQTWFFTDTENHLHQNLTNGHMVNTHCSATHQRKHLCCKTSVEYDYYLASGKKWFCHFDDDNYVNVPQLVKLLSNYSHQEEWYLGRTSVRTPLKVHRKAFWFATGGAGFCISRSLALKMLPVASGGKFITICESIRLPDDVSMGYLIEILMNVNLTLVPEFHSHLEQMKLIPSEIFKDQISFGYSKIYKPIDGLDKGKPVWNVVNVPGFDVTYDPSRFLSLHCFLFPQFEFCPR